ncbi:MAG: AMP-binding protein [Candidatus Promineifilaceae bacterium]
MNIAHSLERAARLFPDHVALLFEGETYTYRHLNECSNRVTNSLVGLGIGRGDRVALFMPNLPAFLIAYYGIHKLGAIVVSINATLKSAELSFILNDSATKAIFTTQALSERIIAADVPSHQHTITVDGPNNAFDAMMADASPVANAVTMAGADPAEILYTSGTTGFPKGATHSHENLVFNARISILMFRMQPSDKVLLYLAAFHNFGLNTVITPTVEACATLVLQREFDVQAVAQAVSEHQVTMFFGVPTIFTLLLDQLDPAQMRSVRFYLSAAASMPVEISRRWADKFGKVIGDGYGLTECFLVTYNHYLKHKHGSAGHPFEGVKMAVVDEQDAPVAQGELGEVVIAGPNVMSGYWQRPDLTAETIRNGWFHTGDIGRIDEDGYFFIVDRVKDMVNVGAQSVYPSEVENVLYRHPAILEAAVYGVPDMVMGEQIQAAIILAAGQSATPQEIMRFCREYLADYKVPQHIELVGELPKSPTGKILKRILRDQVDAEQPLTTNEISVGQEIAEDWLAAWLGDHLDIPVGQIDIDMQLIDYGLTSLFAVSLAKALSDWLGRSISPVITWSYPTIATLAHHLVTFDETPEKLADDKFPTIETVDLSNNLETEMLSDDDLLAMLSAEITLSQQRG